MQTLLNRRSLLLGLVVLPLGGWQEAAVSQVAQRVCNARRQIAVVTNRRETGDTSPDRRYGGDLDTRGNGEQFVGVVLTTCDPHARQNLSTFPRDYNAHLSALQTDINRDRTAGVFVPGSNTTLTQAADRLITLQDAVGLPLGTSVVSWASKNLSDYLNNVHNEEVHAELVKRELLRVLSFETLSDRSVILVAHSRGCGNLLRALSELSRHTPDQRLMRKIKRIVMLAPDFPAPSFARAAPLILQHLDFGITIYATARDKAFEFHATVGAMKLWEDALSPWNQNVEIVDVSVVTSYLGVNHDYGFSSQLVQQDISWAIGDRVAETPWRLVVERAGHRIHELIRLA